MRPFTSRRLSTLAIVLALLCVLSALQTRADKSQRARAADRRAVSLTETFAPAGPPELAPPHREVSSQSVAPAISGRKTAEERFAEILATCRLALASDHSAELLLRIFEDVGLSSLFEIVRDQCRPLDERMQSAEEIELEIKFYMMFDYPQREETCGEWWELVFDEVFNLRELAIARHPCPKSPVMLSSAIALFQSDSIRSQLNAAGFIARSDMPETDGLFDRLCRERITQILSHPDREIQEEATNLLLTGSSQAPPDAALDVMRRVLRAASADNLPSMTSELAHRYLPEFSEDIARVPDRIEDPLVAASVVEYLVSYAEYARDQNIGDYQILLRLFRSWKSHPTPEVALAARKALGEE
ncbi:MAG: hypothetical protein HYY16_18160 [Planctomycetes bacterium]|nr:hypothetical protein [Planctomycetota bacterium]